MIFAISSAPISRIFVAHTIAVGLSYSSVVSAKAACVVAVTSNPSRFSVSPSLFANSTLLSISRIFAGLPGSIMRAPPATALCQLRFPSAPFLASARPGSAPRSLPRHEIATPPRAANPMAPPASNPPGSVRNRRSRAARSSLSFLPGAVSKSGNTAATSSAFRSAFPPRRTPAPRAPAAESPRRFPGSGAQSETSCWAQPVPTPGPPPAQIAGRPAAAARRIVHRVVPSSSRCQFHFRCARRLSLQQRSGCRIQLQQFLLRQETLRVHNRNHVLIQDRQPAVPHAFLVAKRRRQRLQPRHRGHLLDAINQQPHARLAQKKNQPRRRWPQSKVHRRIHDVHAPFAAFQQVPHLGHVGFLDLHGRSRQAVHAAHFLHRSRRNRENLIAAPEQNDLLRAHRRRLVYGLKAHQRAPTGAMRLSPSTRFSMAG